MAEKRPVYSTYVSPEGVAKYCWLDKPDTGFDGKSEPKFKVRILIEDTPKNRAKIDAAIATALAEAKTNGVKMKKVFGNPFKYPEDQDEDDFIAEEGKDKPKLDEDYRDKIFFDAKTGYKPGLIAAEKVDGAFPDLEAGTKIMSGDRIKIKVSVNPYEGLGSGVSLQLKTVQLIEKNTSYARGADKGGFDDDEDEDEAPSKGQSRQDIDDEIPF